MVPQFATLTSSGWLSTHLAAQMRRLAAQGSMGGRPAAFRVGRTRRSRRVMRRCFTHYEGRTAANHPSGDKFDSSYDRGKPAKFAPNQVIRGWTEAMQMMVEGDKWELYIPPRCASIRVRTALAIHVHRTLLG